MAITDIGRNALISREAIKLTAYRDSVGVWTIGVGHTSAAGPPAVTPDLTITRAQALEIFARDLVQYERAVDGAITRPMQDHQRDAFVSICYNIGPAGFRRASFTKRFNAGDIDGCAKAIMQWTKPKEITSRRQGERDQFLTPYISALPKARATDARPVTAAKVPRVAPSVRVAAPPAAETVEKVSSSPKGVLSGLWALLQGKPPVPQAERSAVRAEVREERPDLAKDLGGLRLAGLGTLGASVLGGTADSGLLDTLKQSADGVRDTSTSVKEFADLVIGFIRWGVAHWWIFGLAIGVYMLFRVGWAVFRVYSYVQQRRAIEAALNKGK